MNFVNIVLCSSSVYPIGIWENHSKDCTCKTALSDTACKTVSGGYARAKEEKKVERGRDLGTRLNPQRS